MARFAFLFSAVAATQIAINIASADPFQRAEAKLQPVIEMFDAIKEGQVKVQVIAKDATRANLIFRNQTTQPLRLRVPEAFAGVPVLAQFGGGGGGAGGFGGGGGGQQSFGGGGGGGGFGGGGGGFFQVAPEALRRVQITTVCLEHGKKDPNPRVEYELRPIASVTKDKRVHEVCSLLGHGKLDQQTAQAATWHLTDGLTWDELAQKVKIRHLNGSTEMFFNARQVHGAARVVSMVAALLDRRVDDAEVSPGEQEEARHEPVTAYVQ